jgi:alpha-glucosidase
VLSASLTFLDPGKRYEARIWADTPYTHWETNPTLIDISDSLVEQGTTLLIKLAPGGGQAIHIRPLSGM